MNRTLTIALGLFALTAVARADTVFDFAAPGLTVHAPGSPLTLTEGGITLTATGSPTLVARTLDGIGVWGGVGDSLQIDGLGTDETLTLTFDTEVDLLEVTFTRIGFDDSFTLAVDGAFAGSQLLDPNAPIPQALDLGVVTVDFGGLTGTTFDFGVPGFDDDYKLRSLKVASIPEPAAGALLAMALLMAYRRRRRVA